MKAITNTSNCNAIEKVNFNKRQIKLHFSNSLVRIPIEKIIRLEGDCNYTVVYTQNKKYVSARTLKHYQGILDENFFIRVHKSHIVNIRFVKGVDIQANSSEIAFDEGKNIEISRRKVKEVVEKFEVYNKA
ncbi:Heme-containing CO-sensing transcriptional regulator RcoM 1 [Emticicia aquatica]|jgi:two-component system LytT family response regulator|uniref:Heme-containing CO-sensing transcriptional regulator RcoM 1 n=1 Tax=Emticicia aquatica TaxID=1681835 RepID=A0ABM9AL53_9BACT|nr:LytTR family DNA-binding domain-containing protein [Emticicia aquatica]CAH0994283.1 Heme-containing CO-sensing transcriptional regulator RcoM 1 [Emticicia aquatica]